MVSLNMFTRTVLQMSILHCFVLEVFLVRRTCQQSKVKVKVKQYPSMNFLFFKGYPSDPSVSRGVVALSLQMVTVLACSIQPCPQLSEQPQQSTYITIDNYRIEWKRVQIICEKTYYQDTRLPHPPPTCHTCLRFEQIIRKSIFIILNNLLFKPETQSLRLVLTRLAHFVFPSFEFSLQTFKPSFCTF